MVRSDISSLMTSYDLTKRHTKLSCLQMTSIKIKIAHMLYKLLLCFYIKWNRSKTSCNFGGWQPIPHSKNILMSTRLQKIVVLLLSLCTELCKKLADSMRKHLSLCLFTYLSAIWRFPRAVGLIKHFMSLMKLHLWKQKYMGINWKI